MQLIGQSVQEEQELSVNRFVVDERNQRNRENEEFFDMESISKTRLFQNYLYLFFLEE